MEGPHARARDPALPEAPLAKRWGRRRGRLCEAHRGAKRKFNGPLQKVISLGSTVTEWPAAVLQWFLLGPLKREVVLAVGFSRFERSERMT